MTLEESIKHCEDVADYDCFTDDQWKCSDEHRQLADWLRKLKERREKAQLSGEDATFDCISRQAAIDALWKALYEYEDKTEKQFIDSEELDVADWIQHRNFVQNMSDIDRQTILGLPSAQPERTCVNCGRTANNGGWYADGRTRCPIEEHYALPKDGFCHLWEKRNVTDDDYPERMEVGRVMRGEEE